MKLWLILLVCGLAVAAPSIENKEKISFSLEGLEGYDLQATDPESRNILINALIRQLFNYIRYIINNGSLLFNIPPLDPLELDQFRVNLPAGLINLDLGLKDVLVTGFGGFVVNRSNLRMSDLSFDIEITFPKINIVAGEYDLIGDFFTAIPLYGNGQANFEVDGFVFRAVLFLKQSEDGASVLIDRIESPSFNLPSIKSQLTGVIGGGDIDAIANAIVEEVIVDYVNRFQGVISQIASSLVVEFGNPILDLLDTWRFIAPFVPRNAEQ